MMQPVWLFLFGTAAAMAVVHESSAQGVQIALSSPAFQAGRMIPAQFTCKGANHNPPLQFQGIPANAKSLVLIVDDPDAPGGTFNHWLAWNIAPNTKEIAANSVPAGAAQGKNDFGKIGYGGPCPPSLHGYFFRVFALDKTIDLKSGASRSALDQAIAGHILARGELMGRFGR
jgi:Raf kinase inhibitor-like YbhB/YbcL family protein